MVLISSDPAKVFHYWQPLDNTYISFNKNVGMNSSAKEKNELRIRLQKRLRIQKLHNTQIGAS